MRKGDIKQAIIILLAAAAFGAMIGLYFGSNHNSSDRVAHGAGGRLPNN